MIILEQEDHLKCQSHIPSDWQMACIPRRQRLLWRDMAIVLECL